MHFSKINDCTDLQLHKHFIYRFFFFSFFTVECGTINLKYKVVQLFKRKVPDPLLYYTIEITLSLLAMYLNKSQLQ